MQCAGPHPSLALAKLCITRTRPSAAGVEFQCKGEMHSCGTRGRLPQCSGFINYHVAPGVGYLNVVVFKNCWRIIKSVSNWPRLRVPTILQQDHNHGSHFAVFLFRPPLFVSDLLALWICDFISNNSCPHEVAYLKENPFVPQPRITVYPG